MSNGATDKKVSCIVLFLFISSCVSNYLSVSLLTTQIRKYVEVEEEEKDGGRMGGGKGADGTVSEGGW